MWNLIAEGAIARFVARVRADVNRVIVSAGLFSVGYSMLLFTIPLFAVSVGSSQSELGFIALVYTLPSFFVPLLIGSFLNKAKAVRVIQIAMAAYALPTIFFPYGSNFLQVAAIRAVQGFFGIAFWVSIEKELADLSPASDKGRIFGFYNMSWATAFVVGPFLGGFLIDKFDFKTTFLFAFLFLVAALILPMVTRMGQTSERGVMLGSSLSEEEGAATGQWEKGSLVAACLTAGMTGVILGVMSSLFPAYVTSMGYSALWAGILVLVFNSSRVTTFLAVGLVTDRIGERKFMLMGMLLSVSVAVLGLTSKVDGLAFGLLILGIASGMTHTAGLTLVSRSPPKERGSAIGRFEFSFNLGIAMMSQVGGIGADILGSWSPYLLSGAVTLFGSVILSALYRRMREKRTHMTL